MCATAIRVGVRYLLTEDLQDGLALSGITIVNPFAVQNAALTERILPR
jgi:predicted nucleic acid-binding protein